MSKPARIGLAIVAIVVFVFAAKLYLDVEAERAEYDARVEEIEVALVDQDDPGAALRLSTDALKRFPDDWRLRTLQGQAYHGRGRYGDAIKALSEAVEQAEVAGEFDDGKRARFFLGRARILRYVETNDRDDYKLAEADLLSAQGTGEFSAAAQILLGMGLAQPSVFQDEEEALRLIESGLRDAPRPNGIVELERVLKIREQLEQKLGSGR